MSSRDDTDPVRESHCVDAVDASDAIKAMTTRNRQHAALLTARHDSRVSHRAAGDFAFEHRLSGLRVGLPASNVG